MLDATPILKVYARRRLAQLDRQDARAAQERQLLKLVKQCAHATAFGRDHDFASIRTVADYQQRVPLRRYEQFWEEFWKPVFPHIGGKTWPTQNRYFAASSGTTSGNTKFLPVTDAMLRSNRRAVLDLLTHHCRADPSTRIMAGRSCMLGGSTQLRELARGIFSGDLSGIGARELPWWAKARYFPPAEIAAIADWERKIEAIAPLSLDADLHMLGGTASWLLAYLEHTLALKPGAARIADIYPDLEMLVHGGVNFGPYRRRFEELLAGSRAETREVYPASEGFIGIADRGSGEGLRLILDNGLFFEFVPLEELDSPSPRRFWVGNAEPDVNYAIVLTTCAGLWSYVLGDTVRFVDTKVPRILVTGRTSYSLSAFGEHLIGEEIESAVEAAALAAGLSVIDYSVGAEFPDAAGEKGYHSYIAEFSRAPAPDASRIFIATLDAKLSELNLDYAEHRARDLQMAMPRLHSVGSGTFAAWMKSRGKLGAQNKVPRVINDADLFASLKRFAGLAP